MENDLSDMAERVYAVNYVMDFFFLVLIRQRFLVKI